MRKNCTKAEGTGEEGLNSMASRITPQEIIRMNQLYTQLGTYAAVAREMGRSASAVARYVKLKGTPKPVRIAFDNAIRK